MKMEMKCKDILKLKLVIYENFGFEMKKIKLLKYVDDYILFEVCGIKYSAKCDSNGKYRIIDIMKY